MPGRFVGKGFCHLEAEKMKRLTRLKLEVLRKGWTQRKLARVADIHEATVSLICNGRLNPDPVQRARIAEAIELPEQEIFENQA